MSRLIICLSHDVDRLYKTFQYATHSARALARLDLRGFFYQAGSLFGANPYWQLNELRALEEGLGVRSSFYFLHETYPFKAFRPATWKYSVGYYSLNDPKVAEFIRAIDRDGWEVGLHGSYLSYADEALLAREKRLLEEVVQHTVTGVRQHFLNLDDRTWHIQKKVGFEYDASFGHIRDVGFKDGRFSGFEPPGMDGFTVVPLAIMDFNLMARPDPVGAARAIFEEAMEHDGVVVLNWHQRIFNEKEFPRYRRVYIDLVEMGRELGGEFMTLAEYVGQSGHA